MLMADAQPDDSNCVFEGFDEFDFIFTAEEILAETSDPSNSGSAGTPDGLSCNDPYQHDFFNSDLDKEKSFKPPDGILEAIPGAAQDSCDPSSYLGGHDYKAGLGSECLFENSVNLGTYFNVEFDYVAKENKPVMGPQSHASEWLTLSSSDHNLLSKGPNGGSFDLEHGFDNEQLQSEIPYHFAPYEIANQEAIRIQECKNYNMYDPNGNEMELQLIERAFSLQTESKPHFNHCRSPKVRLQNEGRDSLSHMLIDERVSSIDVYNSAYRSNVLNMGAKDINILPSPSMVVPMGTDATFIDTVHAKLENGQDNVFPSAGNSVVGADRECDGDNLNHYLTGPVISSEEEYASCMEDEREDDMPNHQDGEESNLGTQEKNISFSAGPSRAADTSLSEISCVKLSSCQDMTLKSEASTQHFRSVMNKLPVSDTNVESVAVALSSLLCVNYSCRVRGRRSVQTMERSSFLNPVKKTPLLLKLCHCEAVHLWMTIVIYAFLMILVTLDIYLYLWGFLSPMLQHSVLAASTIPLI
ncbi:hypothetical protein QJS10_CPB11g00943 [Acorus calamus]|uniref:Uncharacterized protein n=1 Tax=Acorus calamus TaxID=4465 RepID=A0AAV9DRM8_ACOCL|nr:hypothetical protein QJS10_CPB11g00943 [Acorus calamus]